MLLLPLAAVAGLAGGRLAGGRLRHLLELRLARPLLPALALAAQLLLGALSSSRPAAAAWRTAVIAGSALLVAWWLATNLAGRRGAHVSRTGRVGLAGISAGFGANLLAMVPFGAMPVSAGALRAAGLGGVRVAAGHLGKHVLAPSGGRGLGSGTAAVLARVLGDVIPLRPFAAVVSPGDVVMAVGCALLLGAAVRAPGGAGVDDAGPGCVGETGEISHSEM